MNRRTEDPSDMAIVLCPPLVIPRGRVSLKPHGDPAYGFRFAPDFHLHAASNDRMFDVWQLNMLMLPMHNATRATAGLPALATNWNLAGAALVWSEKQAAAGKLAHFGSDLPEPYTDTSTPWTRVVSAGFALGSVADASENAGMGGVGITNQDIFNAWMASPPHRANILGPWQYVGFGSGVASGGSMFWTADFGKV